MFKPKDEILLMRAVREGSLNDVKTLLKKGANVNYVDSEGKSTLYYAIKNHHSAIVEKLMDEKADVYHQVSANEFIADHAIDILRSEETKLNLNQKKIVKLFEQKICEDSIRILKSYEELEHNNDSQNRKSEKSFDQAEAAVIEAVMQKVSELLNRLKNVSLDYKAANTFLLFLETFSFDDDLTHKYATQLENKFLNNNHDAYKTIKKLRAILMKSSNKIRTPEAIFEIINLYFNSDHKDAEVDKTIKFFDKLKIFLKNLTSINSSKPTDTDIIDSFSKFFDEKQVKAIIDGVGQKDDTTKKIVYNKFMNLVSKAYQNKVDEEEHWFEFNINIFPCLAFTNTSLLEKQMVHLRNNFVHSFTQHGPDAFEELIVKLRGELFVYYCAKKLHVRLITSITCKTEEIKDEITEDFESIQNDFKNIDRLFLSEEESKLTFASKFEKSLFPTLVSNNGFDQSMIVDYFTFIPIIEHRNKRSKNKSSHYNSNVDNSEEEYSKPCLKLDNFSRRRFFEQYVKMKNYLKKNEKDNYLLEKARLIDDLTDYGIGRDYIEPIFRYYLENGNKLSDDVLNTVENAGKFINYLKIVRMKYIRHSTIVNVVESLLKDRTDLIICTSHSELPKDIIENPEIEKLVKTFNSMIKIHDIEVDVKKIVKMMVKTFYDIFSEYSIEFNIGDLFIRETFLDTLFNEEEKLLQKYETIEGGKKLRLFALINQLRNIDYMSPLIVKLIKHFEKEDGGFVKTLIDENMMNKLIANLISMEGLHFLSILLTIEFDKYDPYKLLYKFVVGKQNNLEDFRQIFDNFDHIKGFTKVLIEDSWDDAQSDTYITQIIIPFIEIINENAADHLYYIKNYSNSRCRILLNKKLQEKLTGVVGPDPASKYLSEIVEQGRENRIHECKAANDILLEIDEIELRFSGKIEACNVNFINRDIMKAKISCIQENYEESFELLNSVIKKLESCEDNYHSHMHDSYKLLTRLIKADIHKLHVYHKSQKGERPMNVLPRYERLYEDTLKHLECEDSEELKIENIRKTFEKIKENDNYKKLLLMSDLLYSEKYFNLLNMASESAYEIQWNEAPTDFKDKENSLESLKKALKIYEGINSYYYEQQDSKSEKSIEYMKYIAKIYKDLSVNEQNLNKKLFYCLKALVRFSIYYDIRKEIPVGFVRNAIKKNIIYALNSYTFAYFHISKTMTDSKDFCNQKDVLQKVYALCKKVLEHNKNSPAENQSKHYVNILSTLADICKYLGKYSGMQTSKSINFYNESLKYFEETINLLDTDSKRINKCFEEMAKINYTLFKELTKNFENRNKMIEAAKNLGASVYFNEKLNNSNMYSKLKGQLEGHCQRHSLNFDKMWNKVIVIKTVKKSN